MPGAGVPDKPRFQGFPSGRGKTAALEALRSSSKCFLYCENRAAACPMALLLAVAHEEPAILGLKAAVASSLQLLLQG